MDLRINVRRPVSLIERVGAAFRRIFGFGYDGLKLIKRVKFIARRKILVDVGRHPR